jgi:hypothetical protein
MMTRRSWWWHGIGFFSDRWRHVDGGVAALSSAVSSAAIPSAAAVPVAIAVVAAISVRV